jgi:hypothetical protein
MSETAEVIQLHKGNGGRKDLYEVGEIPPMGHCRPRCMPGQSGASAMARRQSDAGRGGADRRCPIPTRWSSS